MSLEENADEVKRWLVEKLGRLSSISPDDLSEYILLLVKNHMHSNDFRSICLSKLREFFSGEDSMRLETFVDELREYLSPFMQKKRPRVEVEATETQEKRRKVPSPVQEERTPEEDKYEERRRDRYRSDRHKPRRGPKRQSGRIPSRKTHISSLLLLHNQPKPEFPQFPFDAGYHPEAPRIRMQMPPVMPFVGRGMYGMPQMPFMMPPGGLPGMDRARGNERKTNDVDNVDYRTLEVYNIPAQLNKVEKLGGHFRRFGQVTNIGVDLENSKALIQFASIQEAEKAIMSRMAVLHDRFITVKWVKVPPSFKLSSGKEAKSEVRTPEKSSEVESPAVQSKKKIAHFQQQLEEQKKILEKLENSTGPEKQETLQRVQHLTSALRELIREQTETLQKSTQEVEGMKEQERSDGEADKFVDEESKFTSDGPRRVRGRFMARRGKFRGRGAFNRTWVSGTGGSSMKLDKRTRRMRITDLAESSRTEEALGKHFQVYGYSELEVKDDTAEIVFTSRMAGEKAMSRGSFVEGEKVTMKWIPMVAEEGGNKEEQGVESADHVYDVVNDEERRSDTEDYDSDEKEHSSWKR